MDACDKNKIPPVDHANYSLSEEDGESDFALPGVNVTYTCVEGYHLMDPSNNIVGCDQPQRNDQGAVTLRARWRDADGNVCMEGEWGARQKNNNKLCSMFSW